MGIRIYVITAATESEIDAAFLSLVQLQARALVVQADPFFISRREQLVMLAARYPIPAIYEGRQFAASGKLISYGTSSTYVYREIGVYAGKILKGQKPATLPVMGPTKVEMVINLKAATGMGLSVPLRFC
jgi:putative ABC transport system substrate-binding protein